MIDTLLNKLGGFLDKHFLFSAFIPALIFLGGNIVIASMTIGLQDCLRWYGALELGLQSIIPAIFFLVAFILAYVLSSLRGFILKTWCNIYIPKLSSLFTQDHQEYYRRLRRNGQQPNPWNGLDEELANAVSPQWSTAGRKALDDAGEAICRKILGDLDYKRTPDFFRKTLTDITNIFAQYDGNSLRSFYKEIRYYLNECHDDAFSLIQNDLRQLDLNYGSWGSIRPTTLGNIVAAYNQYPYTRYKIEGEFLWPRLVQVTPDAYNEIIQDKKAFFDFALAMASGFLLSAFTVVIYGPFIWMDNTALIVWPALSASMILAMYLSYKSAVMAARDFGDTLRAACDLFRLDLMKSLHRPRPADLKQEREQWMELSQLMAYGTIQNFSLRNDSGQAS